MEDLLIARGATSRIRYADPWRVHDVRALFLPQTPVWTFLRLAVRNAAKPSRILRCIFKVPSVSAPGRELTIGVEADVSECVPKHELQRLGFEVGFRGQFLRSTIVSYNINEMLGTKMRAMFQRKKRRDLFDLYWALTSRSALPVSIDEVVDAFRHYMREEETEVPRAEFVTHLRNCMGDRGGFCTDTYPLLRSGLTYDPQEAGLFVERHVLSRLPE